MKRIAPLILSLFTPTLLLADGLPLNEDRTKYEGPHYLVKLSEDQLEEVTVSGTLTLTRTQWQEVRKLSPSAPKRIDAILPSTFNDCTCGLDPTYGVWFKDGTVAVAYETNPVPFEKLTTEIKDELTKDLHFRMDERGQFYHDNKLIPYSEVKARVAYLRATPIEVSGDNLNSLSIGIPPHSKASDAALADRLKELQKIAKAAGRYFFVAWDITGLEEE